MFRIDCNFERAFAQGTQIQDKDKQIFQLLEKNALQFTKTEPTLPSKLIKVAKQMIATHI